MSAPGSSSTLVDALRHDTVHVLAALIADRRAAAADPLSIDLEEAERQASALLDEHALAIAELGIDGLFDLLASGEGGELDAEGYAAHLKLISDEEIAAEARADATGSADAIERIRRRRALFEGARSSAQLVVRGVLGAAIVGALSRRFPVGAAAPPE